MSTPFVTLLAAGLILACTGASAQPGPASGASAGVNCGPRGGASAAAGDCPGGMRHGMGARWGRDYTPGWSMMTPAERQQHQEKLGALNTYEECRSYMDQHHEQMAARAKDKGLTLPAKPRHDACATLPRSKK
ncbi:hypothetical protein [Ideonella sp. YS5]|uniref:hypothetical protein n=1 Tax=Ideonella sp. YS5 TaxID=3453714 RepID=UPI003EEB3272